ncbi:PREDICTED: putative uncharacterized protein DDB_G0282499 [Nicotiana attenuata]|uniref:putative uncharacterized protein DDB_G0282499 n=1 Tax=Nicotiana attenuata TaxID=49451 RepID=UPI000905144C|nr:PREDICTED: putative uncharacterized protein DDB_G0282499 [Nicotiana attenuata]
MAFLANHLSFFLLITLLSSLQIHARDNKFFNKISTNNNGHEKETKEVTPNKEQEPNFIPENENGYGVYDESGQLSPSTTTPMNNLLNSKYLPKNYNPVAYVTVPQDNPNNNNDDNNNNNYNQYYNGDTTYGNVTDNNNNNYNQYYSGDNTYDNGDNNNQYYSGDNTYNNNNNNHYHNGGSDYYNNNNYPGKNVGNSYYNDQEQSYPLDYNHYNVGNGQGVQKQRMSDTRVLENGKYSYDVNTEKYVRDPHENSREFANSYADNELSNYNNVNFVKYENEEEFQPEGDMP